MQKISIDGHVVTAARAFSCAPGDLLLIVGDVCLGTYSAVLTEEPQTAAPLLLEHGRQKPRPPKPPPPPPSKDRRKRARVLREKVLRLLQEQNAPLPAKRIGDILQIEPKGRGAFSAQLAYMVKLKQVRRVHLPSSSMPFYTTELGG